jgi:1,4-dihydroxy-2-naphthoate octaprenyltransferase
MSEPELTAAESMDLLRGWYLAARPATLPAAVVPVLVGTALAISARQFHLIVFLATLVCSLLIQIGTNFANDYYDFRKGADTAERLGPTRVTQSGIFTPRQVLLATGYTFALALLLGAYLVAVGGAPILAVGILSILCGIGYTGGPFPLGYHGLGDLFVFVFFGLIAVAGTFYLQTGTVTLHVLLASVPVGLLCANILVVNNLRDIDTDRAAGKRTLAARIGREATRQQYMLFQLISYTIPFTLWQIGASWDYTFWLPLLTLPRAVRLSLYLVANQDRALNKALKGTAELHLRFGALFALSLLR